MDAVIVTGSAGAIGVSLVDVFSNAGYFVIGVDRAHSHAADESIVLDLADLAGAEAETHSARERVLAAVGDRHLKVLVNNAAVQMVGPVSQLSVDTFRRTLDVNVTAAFALVQTCLDRLAAAGGCVINIGSIHARLTKPHFSAYAASKGAVESLTRALAVELGNRIRVNAISPAAIDTPMLRAGFEASPDSLRQLADYHPCGTVGRPEDVARLALFMAGPEAAFMNGAVVELTGGIAGRLHDPG